MTRWMRRMHKWAAARKVAILPAPISGVQGRQDTGRCREAGRRWSSNWTRTASAIWSSNDAVKWATTIWRPRKRHDGKGVKERTVKSSGRVTICFFLFFPFSSPFPFSPASHTIDWDVASSLLPPARPPSCAVGTTLFPFCRGNLSGPCWPLLRPLI